MFIPLPENSNAAIRHLRDNLRSAGQRERFLKDMREHLEKLLHWQVLCDGES
jgi:hypothetical protein